MLINTSLFFNFKYVYLKFILPNKITKNYNMNRKYLYHQKLKFFQGL